MGSKIDSRTGFKNRFSQEIQKWVLAWDSKVSVVHFYIDD